jgi:hypothetical protein
MDQTRRCVDCGLVGMRHVESGEFRELDEITRENGHPKGRVACSAFAADLYAELQALGQDRVGVEGGNLRAVLRKERDCDSFCKWNVGLSPRDHKQMIVEVEREKLRAEEKRRAEVAADLRLQQQREESRLLRQEDKDRRFWDFWKQVGIAVGSAILGWLLRSSPAKQDPPVVNVLVPNAQPQQAKTLQ